MEEQKTMSEKIIDKQLSITDQLIKEDFLTSDSFHTPDAEYIFLDFKYENPIRFRRLDDQIIEFNIEENLNTVFRKVVRRFENVSHWNEH